MKCIIYIIFLLPFYVSAQIQIDAAGDFWDRDVKEALDKIKSIDTSYYNLIANSCNKISFWNGGYSTNFIESDGMGTILISAADMKIGDIDNVCSVLVHESLHLRIKIMGISLDQNSEEILCYKYELGFLYMIPDVGGYLIDHVRLQIASILIKN